MTRLSALGGMHTGVFGRLVTKGGKAYLGPPFRADLCLPNPGLKPWAMVCDHFMVKDPGQPMIHRPQITLHLSLLTDY